MRIREVAVGLLERARGAGGEQVPVSADHLEFVCREALSMLERERSEEAAGVRVVQALEGCRALRRRLPIPFPQELEDLVEAPLREPRFARPSEGTLGRAAACLMGYETCSDVDDAATLITLAPAISDPARDRWREAREAWLRAYEASSALAACERRLARALACLLDKLG